MTRKKSKNVSETPQKCDISSSTRKNCANNAAVLKCSRKSMAVALLKEKNKNKRPRRYPVAKCKMTDRAGILPYYQSYIAIQIRNALVTHNWEAAALFLRILLRNPTPKLYRFIWRAYFLIVQHMPENCGTRMERFQEMCNKVLKDEDFLTALTIPEDEENDMEED